MIFGGPVEQGHKPSLIPAFRAPSRAGLDDLFTWSVGLWLVRKIPEHDSVTSCVVDSAEIAHSDCQAAAGFRSPFPMVRYLSFDAEGEGNAVEPFASPRPGPWSLTFASRKLRTPGRQAHPNGGWRYRPYICTAHTTLASSVTQSSSACRP